MEAAHAAYLAEWRAQEFYVPQAPRPPAAAPKPRTPGPVQMSLFDEADIAAPLAEPSLPSALLTALIDDAGVGRRRPREVAIVEAAIAATIPADVPTFAAEILSVRRTGDAILARVRLFDGGVVSLTVSVDGEPAVRAWQAEGDQRAFHYVDGAWARFDEAKAPPTAEAPPTRRPSPEDVAYVERAIRDALPKSVPSYAKEVLSIRKGRGVMVIRLRLFDDEIGVLRLSGVPEAHGYGWDFGEQDPRPFTFDMDAWA